MNYRSKRYNQFGDIDCEIEHPEFGWIPFTASASDSEPLGREVYAEIMAAGNIAPYQPPPPPTNDELAADAKRRRNALLAESDWTQLPDVSDEISVAWQPYRQALRDITNQAGFPTNIKWPVKPGE